MNSTVITSRFLLYNANNEYFIFSRLLKRKWICFVNVTVFPVPVLLKYAGAK